MSSKIKIVKHTSSGSYLYGGWWVTELPEDIEASQCGLWRDIKYKGKSSDGIIDTDVFSPEDFGRESEEWDDDDDLLEDYEEVEIEISKFVVSWSNIRPDYRQFGPKGYFEKLETFNTKEGAENFLRNLNTEKYSGGRVAEATPPLRHHTD